MTIWTRERVIDLSVKIDGWMDRDELGWLFDRAQEVPKGGVWVEIGCWKGRSFMATAMGLPSYSIFHAVDTWSGDSSSEAHWESREIPGWILGNFSLSVAGFRSIRHDHDSPSIMIHHGCSKEVVPNIPLIDAAFLDGLHDYHSVGDDLDIIYPRVKPGGLISGHDFHLESVQQAVNERFPEVQIGAKNIWYFHKEK